MANVEKKLFNNFMKFINEQEVEPYEVCSFIYSLLNNADDFWKNVEPAKENGREANVPVNVRTHIIVLRGNGATKAEVEKEVYHRTNRTFEYSSSHCRDYNTNQLEEILSFWDFV